jgi:hypothetical protein
MARGDGTVSANIAGISAKSLRILAAVLGPAAFKLAPCSPLGCRVEMLDCEIGGNLSNYDIRLNRKGIAKEEPASSKMWWFCQTVGAGVNTLMTLFSLSAADPTLAALVRCLR